MTRPLLLSIIVFGLANCGREVTRPISAAPSTPAVDRAKAEPEATTDLYVDAASATNGDGTSEHPFWRITDALAMARTLREVSDDDIVVHIRPGTYVGSYTKSGPRIEPLPIRVDVLGLTLSGSTTLERDELGLPTGKIEPGTDALVVADPPISGPRVLMEVGATQENAEIERVTIARLGLDTKAAQGVNGNLLANRVHDLTVRDSYFASGDRRGTAVLFDSLASGRITGNYLSRLGAGISITAGTASSPRIVLISGNRAVDNRNGGMYLSTAGTLVARVCGNDFSANVLTPGFSFGIRVAALVEPGELTRSVTATICDNQIRKNRFGIVIDAGFAIRSPEQCPPISLICDPRDHSGEFTLSFDGNEIAENLSTPALITFTRNSAALDPLELSTYKYLMRSTFEIRHGGELDGYWFDHPASDPIDGRILENVLRINGRLVPNGRDVPFHP